MSKVPVVAVIGIVLLFSPKGDVTEIPISIYPKEALDAGIEGWVELVNWVNNECDLEFEIVDAEPAGVFENAAFKSLRQQLVFE